MNVFIVGTGLVSVLGRGLPLPCETGSAYSPGWPEPSMLTAGGFSWPVFRVPPRATADIDGFPRLRRSGDVSRFAVAAAVDACAGIDPALCRGMPLFFATTDGGVRHTTRFLAGIEADGAGGGSPLLFPETVYNAPASHVAAKLGISAGATTLVGDSSVGLAAVCAACDTLAAGLSTHALVVAASECDPLACAAYALAGVSAAGWPSPLPPIAEGAAAVLLTSIPPAPRPGCTTIVSAWTEAPPIVRASQAPAAIGDLLASLQAPASRPVFRISAPFSHSFPSSVPLLPGEGMAFADLAQVVVIESNAENESNIPLVSIGFGGECAGLCLTQHSLRA